LIDVDLVALVRFHEQGVACHGRVAATLVVRDDPEVDRWGPVEMDAGNRVLRINGKGVPAGSVGQAVARRMFAGVHVVDPRVLQDVPRGQPSSIIDAYVTNLARGAVLLGYAMTGYWSDVGTPERYAQVQRDSEAGRIDLARRRAGA
ncbi:MAG: nucleotidyltransferase family protein, partial [Nitrospirales bacterium]